MRGAVVIGLLWVLACTSPPSQTVALEPPQPFVNVRDPQPPASRNGLSVDIAIDGRKSASGWIGVTQTWRGIEGPFSLKRHGDDGAYEMRSVSMKSDGATQGFVRKGSRYDVRGTPPSTLTVSYEFKPGNEGRHGRQGFADDRFAVFDGRALLLPIGEQDLAAVRYTFELPKGWTPATALTEGDEGWWLANAPAGTVMLERLLKECHGLGPWRQDDTRLGATTVRSFVHAELEPELQERVAADTAAIWGWFHHEVGFDPGYTLAFVRTPADSGGRIFGGASMMGACYEAEWERDTARNTVLLGHRFGHPFNKYPPAGLTPAGADEHWFTEGWASYAEVVAAEATGRAPLGTNFPKLFSTHHDMTREHGDWASIAMQDEGKNGAATEYLHYFRGPLLVRTLAHLVESRSDTNLEAFMRHMAASAGSHQRVYHLQSELEAFTGATYGDFWAAYVHGGLPVVPSFDGIIDGPAVDRAARPVVAHTAGVGVDANYLAALAASGRFESFQQLADFVGAEGPNRQALAADGIHLVPERVHQHVVGLSPFARESLARAEAAWPAHLRTGRWSRVAPSLTWKTDEQARMFTKLLQAEEADAAITLAGGFDAIHIRRGDKNKTNERPDVLAVPADQPFTLYAWWREPLAAVRVDVLLNDELVWSKDVIEQPGWIRNRLTIEAADRPALPGVLTIRVHRLDGALLAQRSFLQWQL